MAGVTSLRCDLPITFSLPVWIALRILALLRTVSNGGLNEGYTPHRHHAGVRAQSVSNWQTEKAERNRRSFARLSKALPPIFPAAISENRSLRKRSQSLSAGGPTRVEGTRAGPPCSALEYELSPVPVLLRPALGHPDSSFLEPQRPHSRATTARASGM